MNRPKSGVALGDPDLACLMRTVCDAVLTISSDITLIFVTNLQSGGVADLGDHGILNTAQYYTRNQADEIIRSLQSLGVTVQSFFSELEFIRWAVTVGGPPPGQHTVVFTTAEGGTGPGRRALIPALCNLLSLPILNSGPHACSLARHKFHANAVLRRMGLRAPMTWLFRDGAWLGDDGPAEGTCVIVKPTYESMCIGVHDDSVVVVDVGFERFVQDRNVEFGQPVLVQEFVSGDEVGVPIVRIGSTYALPPISFRRANGDHYGNRPKTFQDENIHHDTSHVPFQSAPPEYRALQRAATLAFDSLEMGGVGRIDFRIDADGRAWIFDTNEAPPPLKRTAYSIAMEILGFSLEEMLAVWLGACLIDNGIVSGV